MVDFHDFRVSGVLLSSPRRPKREQKLDLGFENVFSDDFLRFELKSGCFGGGRIRSKDDFLELIFEVRKIG